MKKVNRNIEYNKTLVQILVDALISFIVEINDLIPSV